MTRLLLTQKDGRPCQTEALARPCSMGDLPAVEALQNQVCAALPDPALFKATPREELARYLAQGALLVGVWAEGRLAAYGSVVYEGESPGNYAWDMGLPGEQVPGWANLDTTIVHPAWRGNGLQQFLLRYCEQRRRPQILGFGCTVSPNNPHSLANVRAAGFVPVCEKRKYGGLRRVVLKKHLAPLPGFYRHFKGGRYQVLYPARHSETGEEMVVYRALYGEGGLWVRPAAMWGEWVCRGGYSGPRFIYEGPASQKATGQT